MASLFFLGLMAGLRARGCFFFVATVLGFQYLLRVVRLVVDRPPRKQRVVLATKAFLGAVFDALLVLASLKQDELMRRDFWDYCIVLWVAFPLFAVCALVAALLLLAKLTTVVFLRHTQGPTVGFYAWLFLMSSVGTVMLYLVVGELTASSRLAYRVTSRLLELYVAAVIYLGSALLAHLLCRDTLR